jgi:hypothetical protein
MPALLGSVDRVELLGVSLNELARNQTAARGIGERRQLGGGDLTGGACFVLWPVACEVFGETAEFRACLHVAGLEARAERLVGRRHRFASDDHLAHDEAAALQGGRFV